MLNILCLENNSEDVKMIERYLRNAFDYELLHVRTENEYKSALFHFKPDLILSDYLLLGDFNGLKALQIRNKECPLIPFIVVTESVNAEEAALLMKNGASDLVTKKHLDKISKVLANALKQSLLKKETLKEQEKLQEFNSLFATFVENDISGVYMERKDKVVYANPRLLDILDFHSVEEINRYGPANLYLNPEDRIKLFRELEKKGKVTDFAITLRTKKGRVLYVLENAFVQKDATGEIDAVYGYIYDITELKEAEARREESERLFKSISQHTNAGIVIYDTQTILYANRKICQLLEYTEQELLQMSWLELFHPDSHKEVLKNAQLRLEGNAANVEFSYKILTKNKKIKWVAVTGNNFKFKGKDAALVTVYDITKMKLAQDTLMRQNKRNLALLRILESPLHDLKQFLEYVMNEMLGFLDARTGSVYLYNEDTETFELFLLLDKEADKNKKDKIDLSSEPSLDPIWEKTLKQRKPVFGSNQIFIQGVRLDNFLSIPIFEEKRVVAVIAAANKANGFSEEDINDIRLMMDVVWKGVQNIKAHQEIIEREKNFKDIVENNPNGVVIFDLNGGIRYANALFLKLTGYTAGDVQKMNFYDHFTLPGERALFQSHMEKIFTGRTHQLKHYRTLITKNGEKIPAEFFTTTTVWYGKKMQLSLITDLTEKKKAEEISFMLHFAFEQIPASVVVTDINANIEYVNPYFTKLTGYTQEEVLGQNPRILQSGKTPKEIYPVLWDTILSGKAWEGEFINRRKNGREYIERALIGPIKNSSGEIVRFMAIKEDVTLKKKYIQGLIRAKEKAQAAERLKTNFLANVSHELRTPLNGIIGFSELMETEDSPETLKTMVGYIKTSSLRLLNTLNLIIDFSILNAENITVKKSKFDLINTLRTIQVNFADLAKNKNLFLYFQPDVDQLEIVFDKSILEKVVSNLVDNAIKFTSNGGVSIEVDHSLFDESGVINISVRDTGIGIPKKYRKVIFEPFRQVSEGYGRNYEGLGLGLSICKKYIETLGGKISLSSVPGKGSVFTITFTADHPDAELLNEDGESERIPVKNKRGSGSVLYLKEKMETFDFVYQLLSEEYNVKSLYGMDVKQTDLIQSEHFDLIIVNTERCGNKWESAVVEELCASTLNKNTPKIVLCTIHVSDRKTKRKNDPYHVRLLKPVDNEKFLKTVETLLRKKGQT